MRNRRTVAAAPEANGGISRPTAGAAVLRAARAGLLMAAVMATALAAGAASWPPVTAAERQFSAAQLPGAPGVVLEKQVNCNNIENIELHFVRLKILRRSGLDLATVKVPYFHGGETLSQVSGETIEPDGTVVPFNGQVRRAEVLRENGVRVSALEFDLPQARVGSILDYRYTLGYNAPVSPGFSYTLLPETIWRVQGRLFVRRESFTLIPNRDYPMQMFPIGLTARQRPKMRGREVTLRLENIPALPSEPMQPPDALLRKRVIFVYSASPITGSPKDFWRGQGKKWAKAARRFAGSSGSLQPALAALRLTGSPEARLRAIYTRVLEIRNTDNGSVAGALPDHDAAAALARNYGSGRDINLTLVALARAAGFQAYWLHSPERADELFAPVMRDPAQLDNQLAMVQLPQGPVYLDPGGGCPYGVLNWWETGVRGLIARRKGGVFVVIPVPHPSGAERDRSLELRWAATGGWAGTLRARWTGEARLELRQQWRQDDAAGRGQDLTRMARGWLPVGSQLTLVSSQGWDAGAETLQAQWNVALSDLGAAVVWPQDLLNIGHRPLLTADTRLEPLYFHHPCVDRDTVRIHLLPQSQPPRLPAPVIMPDPQPANSPLAFSERSSLVPDGSGTVLQMQRELRVNVMVVPAKQYAIVKNFFAIAARVDHEQVAVRVTAPVVRTQ